MAYKDKVEEKLEIVDETVDEQEAHRRLRLRLPG